MSETSEPELGPATDAAGEDPGADSELRRPLTEAELSPAASKFLAGPLALRKLAARGIAPLRPADLAVVVFQLGHDPDEELRAAARAAPRTLPDNLLLPILREPLPAPVLFFFATGLDDHRADAVEALLLNPATPDRAFVTLGQRLHGELLEMICQNEARILRCPAIARALFQNPAARMSSVNRALELCARNGIEVDIPGFDEIVKAIGADPDATSGARDEIFAQTATTATRDDLKVDLDAELATEEQGAAGEKADAKAERKRDGGPIDFSRLKIFEKIRLATFGNEYCRFNLIRDPNRLVAMAAVRSPKIGEKEIIAAASSRAVHADVIRYISNSREALKKYSVRLGLVNNPKCPQQTAVRLLSTLQLSDVKKLASSKNVPAAIATTARRMLDRRAG